MTAPQTDAPNIGDILTRASNDQMDGRFDPRDMAWLSEGSDTPTLQAELLGRITSASAGGEIADPIYAKTADALDARDATIAALVEALTICANHADDMPRVVKTSVKALAKARTP